MKWEDTVVLVTGGTGSFGKKFAEILLKTQHPKKLIIFSRDELKQHEMRMEGFNHPSIRYFLGDVRDADRLKRAMYGVDVVVHAAALKQVPACEYNPFEAVMTNIIGARNIISSAVDEGVKKVLALSTDKAVSPANLYGATKLVMEKLFIHGNNYSGDRGTRLSCVRYGNVVGSRGSVIPLFLKQKSSGRFTVTDPNMTRFWLTLEKGVSFVLQCIEEMQGREIFIPKCATTGILDLAEAICPECELDYIGIRAGEKIHETLVSPDEARVSVDCGDMYVVYPHHVFDDESIDIKGERLSAGFSYTSSAEEGRLSSKEIVELLKDVDGQA